MLTRSSQVTFFCPSALVDITCTLLLLNPDFTTAWNVRYRHLVLQHNSRNICSYKWQQYLRTEEHSDETIHIAELSEALLERYIITAQHITLQLEYNTLTCGNSNSCLFAITGRSCCRSEFWTPRRTCTWASWPSPNSPRAPRRGSTGQTADPVTVIHYTE